MVIDSQSDPCRTRPLVLLQLLLLNSGMHADERNFLMNSDLFIFPELGYPALQKDKRYRKVKDIKWCSGGGDWSNELFAVIKAYEHRDWNECERIMDEVWCSDFYQRVEAAKDKKRHKGHKDK